MALELPWSGLDVKRDWNMIIKEFEVLITAKRLVGVL